MKNTVVERKQINFKIGQRVMCLNEDVKGIIEYIKDGWIGVRTVRTSNIIPQHPSNLKRL